jgi:hypothetical protein
MTNHILACRMLVLRHTGLYKLYRAQLLLWQQDAASDFCRTHVEAATESVGEMCCRRCPLLLTTPKFSWTEPEDCGSSHLRSLSSLIETASVLPYHNSGEKFTRICHLGRRILMEGDVTRTWVLKHEHSTCRLGRDKTAVLSLVTIGVSRIIR